MGQIEDAVMKWIEANLPEAMREASSAQIQRTQFEVSELFPPASIPGTPPHLRAGLIKEGLVFEEEGTPNAIIHTMRSSRANRPEVPECLERGTPKMEPRPYMGPMKERVISEYAEFVAAELRDQLN